ncbi:hypothetical protein AWB71_04322 [Caballeronia peredens]|nr:hypothetical protein AWB71_04322 [Caballeronia peredens]
MEYVIVTARLEDVTNVITTGRSPQTSFNATIEGRRYCGLDIGGRPSLKSGMTVTAALRRANDWYSLAGWMNHESGEVEGITPPELSLFSAYAMLIAAASAFKAFLDHGEFAASAFMLVALFGLVAADLMLSSKTSWDVQKQLRSNCATFSDPR